MMEENPDFPTPKPAPATHPLRALFQQIVADAFQHTLGLPQPSVSVYLGDLLTAFAHADTIYQVRDLHGRQLRSVAEMLMATDAPDTSTDFDYERRIHKHIGDFTLFWAGIYPDMLRRLRDQGRADHLIDYVRQGKQSYRIVSTYQQGRYAEDAGLFRLLSEDFELCLYGMGLVRREWERFAEKRGPVV